MADDLFILGYYTWSGLGKQIKLYYGSFTAVLGRGDEETYRAQIRETLRHEFRHHLEALGGVHNSSSLEAEDEREKRAYLAAHEKRG